MAKPRRCYTGKLRHFNEAWAEIAAQKQSEDFESHFRTYRCRCGWWHTYDRSKRNVKLQKAETRSARRKRAKRGEPPPSQTLREQQQLERKQRLREARRFKQRRSKLERQLPERVWEDDGGAPRPLARPAAHRGSRAG